MAGAMEVQPRFRTGPVPKTWRMQDRLAGEDCFVERNLPLPWICDEHGAPFCLGVILLDTPPHSHAAAYVGRASETIRSHEVWRGTHRGQLAGP